jgi:DNA-binding protein HU-beta
MSGSTAADAERVLDGFRDVVQATVNSGGEVSYPGLGKFSRVSRKARMGRNPQTGATIQVAASNAPKFSASSRFKSIVKGEASAPYVPSA